MKARWQNLFKVWLVAAIVLLAQLAAAAPTLPGDMIVDLKSMERQLQSGEYAKVRHHGRAQAQRLEGGNASDRWARALYLQLAASAEARLGNAVAAAELLEKARGIREMEPAQVDRWQYQEARLRLKANQLQQARDLLSNWLERHAGSATDRWLMVQLLSEDGQ